MKAGLIKNEFEEGWFEKLTPFIETEEFDNIFKFLKSESQSGVKCWPESKNLFRAFRETPYKDLKVVIIGQDPYPQSGVADGLAFSCSLTNQCQPSLIEIHREIERTVYNGMNLSGNVYNPDLSYLARQGVLLLNTALTVKEGVVGSHYDIWKPFIENIIHILNNDISYKSGLVFILMGSVAVNSFKDKIAPFTHDILTVSHPASVKYSGGRWDCKNIFNDTNDILDRRFGVKINW